MKPILFFILALLVTVQALHAQSIRTEPYIGLSFSSMSLVVEGEDYTDNLSFLFASKSGVNIGVLFSQSFTEYLSLESGIGLNSKGYTFSLGLNDPDYWGCVDTCIDTRSDMNAYYLEIPLLLKIALPTKDRLFHVFGGPVAGLGLAGTYSSNGTEWNDPDFLEYLAPSIKRGVEEGSISWGSDRESFPRMNFSYEIGMNIVFDFISVRIAYQKGLSNVVGNNSPDSSGRVVTSAHHQTYFTLGYRFGR